MTERNAPSVAVVITVFNEEPRYLAEAIESVRAQSIPVDETIVVEDGALRNYDIVYAAYSGLRIIRQANQGLAAARNTGLHAATADFILFLDGDDRMAPQSLAINLRRLIGEPDAIMSYGTYRLVDSEGLEWSVEPLRPTGADPYETMLEGNCIGMHGTVLYRRQALLDAGAFDPSFRMCEDYELYLRLARRGGILHGPEVLADYRHHGANISNDRAMMLSSVLRALDAQTPHVQGKPRWEAARARGRADWKGFFARRQLGATLAAFTQDEQLGLPAKVLFRIFSMIPVVTSREATMAFLQWLRRRMSSRTIDLGALRQRVPISRDFGYERGNPVDRHYIERFLAEHAGDVRGRVLEVGDNAYTMRFGGEQVEKSEVLHVDPEAPNATYCTDLATGEGIPDDRFDCILLTQTLHLVYEFREAAATLDRILKPGGVLLLTVPGVSSIDRREWGERWCWSFTPGSLRRLMSDQFGEAAVELTSYGNVLTATAFLYGLAESDLVAEDFAYQDPQYPVIVAVRVRKKAE